MLKKEIVTELAEKFDTPLYVYEEKTIREQCRKLKNAISYPNTRVRYACKALSLISILKIVKEEGLSIDASSENEVRRALIAGFAPEEILYTGEDCYESLWLYLLEQKVPINCSSLDQVRLLGEISRGASFSFRLNPGEGHGFHKKLNTGGPFSKHGIYFTELDKLNEIVSKYNLKIEGLHTHIGSGTDINHWLRIKDLTFECAKKYPGLKFIDLGGGLPVVYNKESDVPLDLERWGKELSLATERFVKEYGTQIELQIEPGRFVIAESGYLLGRVQGIKSTSEANFVIVNTGLTHNPRPTLYGAYHPIQFVSKKEGSGVEKDYIVAGNLCESGDAFTVDSDGTPLPRRYKEISIGDIMVMSHTGAYCHAMSSVYNSMCQPASVLLKEDGTFQVIEKRGTLEGLMAREVF